MKKAIQIISLLNGILAVLSVILNFQVIFGGKSGFFRYAMFSMVKNGGAMGYLGNLVSMLIVAAGFGAMCIFGLHAAGGGGMKSVRTALTAGGIMTVMSVISLICSIAGGMFSFGDIIILILPALYTFLVFSASDKL